MDFCIKYKDLIYSKTGISIEHFYTNNWNKLINFLRKIIRDIEVETLKNVNKRKIFIHT